MLLPKDTPVIATFKTKGLDAQPYIYSRPGRVIAHKKGGWLTLDLKGTQEFRYRVHFAKKKIAIFWRIIVLKDHFFIG